jgi:F-type H+-transporting ATPase subunit b
METDASGYAVGMPQLDPAIWPNLIFWLVVSIVLLYFILSRVALPRLGTVLAERQDAISNDLEMAALLKRRAEEAEGPTRRRSPMPARRRCASARQARAEIQEELKALMAKADAEIAAKSAESEKRIGEIRDGAARSVEEVARETAIAIVAALMPKLADQQRGRRGGVATTEGVGGCSSSTTPTSSSRSASSSSSASSLYYGVPG